MTNGSTAGASAGVTQVGYLAFEVSDLDVWERFASDVLGLSVVDRGDDGSFGLRMDSYSQRFFVRKGDADDVSAVGFEVVDETTLDAVTKRLESAGVDVTRESDAAARTRNVARLASLRDPAGTRLELYCGPERADAPFASDVLLDGFVADELGFGHAVLTAKDKAESAKFYGDLLGFRLSDHIVCEYFGFPVDLSFFHVNARHHTVAFGGPQPKRIHHFMLEAKSMDDVGLCFDRALRSGVKIAQTLGKHPNDRMFSFYALTPSGFQFEFGWGGRTVDDADWTPTTYDRISEWGHHPPQVFAKPRSKS